MLFNNRCCMNRCMNRCCDYTERPEVITEPVNTTCVEKEFYHEVPHVCPMHTHVINRHIYNHTYTPQYTCSEENQIVNNDCGSCCNLR